MDISMQIRIMLFLVGVNNYRIIYICTHQYQVLFLLVSLMALAFLLRPVNARGHKHPLWTVESLQKQMNEVSIYKGNHCF